MERAGLEVLDIENLRRHYALTLDRGRALRPQLGAHPRARSTALRRALPPRVRVYLYGCAEMFRSPKGTRTCSRSCSPRATSRRPAIRWPGFLYEQPAYTKKEALAARLRQGSGPVGLAKDTSNLFRDRAGAAAAARRPPLQ